MDNFSIANTFSVYLLMASTSAVASLPSPGVTEAQKCAVSIVFPQPRCAVVLFSDGSLASFEVAASQPVASTRPTIPVSGTALALSADGSSAAIVQNNVLKTFRLPDLTERTVVSEGVPSTALVALDQSGATVAVWSLGDDCVNIKRTSLDTAMWDCGVGKDVLAITMAPDGNSLAVSSAGSPSFRVFRRGIDKPVYVSPDNSWPWPWQVRAGCSPDRWFVGAATAGSESENDVAVHFVDVTTAKASPVSIRSRNVTAAVVCCEINTIIIGDHLGTLWRVRASDGTVAGRLRAKRETSVSAIGWNTGGGSLLIWYRNNDAQIVSIADFGD